MKCADGRQNEREALAVAIRRNELRLLPADACRDLEPVCQRFGVVRETV